VKYILRLSLLVFSTSLLGQKDLSIDILSSYNNVGIYENTSSFTSDNSGVSNINTIRFGANFNFRIYERVMVKTGIRYTTVGDLFFLNDLRWPSEIGPNGFEPDPSLPRYINSYTKHRYINIPIAFRHQLNQSKFNTFIEYGFSLLLYLDTDLITESNISEEKRTINYIETNPNFNSTQYTMNFSFGANYDLSNSIQLYGQPNFQVHLNKTFSGSVPNRYYSIGLEIGIRKQFGSYFNKEKS